MNIFHLDNDVTLAARYHLDKHCVKMILEYTQILSTAHRYLDGKLTQGVSKTGRNQKLYKLSDSSLDNILYKATHVNHPSMVWTRESKGNYFWLAQLLNALCKEYTHRYKKIHKVERDGLLEVLLQLSPNNINDGPTSSVSLAMPDEYKQGSSIESYRNYYIGAKKSMAKWTNREMPSWFLSGINKKYNEACYVFIDQRSDKFVSMPSSLFKAN